MTDRELRRLSRAALIELLIAQMEENEKLEGELERLKRQASPAETAPAPAREETKPVALEDDPFLEAFSTFRKNNQKRR